jgi:uncharacterized protein YgiM (DUF1202 family)
MRKFLFTLFLLVALTLPLHAQDTPQPNAQVQRMSSTLNLRETPASDGTVIVELAGATPLIVTGRTRDNAWLQVQTTDGQAGWVSAAFVELDVALDSLPIVGFEGAPAVEATQPSEQEATSTAEAPAPVENAPAYVKILALNLRASPSTRAAKLAELPNGTPLIPIARTGDNRWLKVQTGDGLEGWVFTEYVQLNIGLPSLPTERATTSSSGTTSTTTTANAPTQPTNVISGITANARTIFRRGQTMGNRADVFSKVGDSMTVATDMYDPIGRNTYVLGDYAYLQPVIDFYLQTFARDQNSFANTSLAAGSGWTTATLLDPNAANTAVCKGGETPLVCEYTYSKPAVALIMLGSNDVMYFDAATFGYNLGVITQTSIDMGVIPVLSTIPIRVGYEEKVNQFNAVIRETADTYDVPLWDYASVMATLPNSGLSGDGLHPSTSPSGYAGAANFTGENLSAGYVQRNLTMLQVLDALYRQVLTQ